MPSSRPPRSTPRPKTPRTLAVAELRAECTTLVRAVLAARCATPEAVAVEQPGGARNPTTDVRAWLGFYRYLHRTHAVGVLGADGGGIARADAGAAPSARADLIAAADEPVVLDALREAPLALELTDGRIVSVSPKSFTALQWAARVDARLRWLLAHRARLVVAGPVTGATASAGDDLVARLDAEVAYQYALLVWAACTPGPGLPFAEHEVPDGVPPWIAALSPADLLRLCAAFQQVNTVRLAALNALLSASTSADAGADAGTTDGPPPTVRRPQWATFFAARADDQHTTAAALMRDRSLGAVLSETIVASATRAAAQRDAERRARADGGGAPGPATPGIATGADTGGRRVVEVG